MKFSNFSNIGFKTTRLTLTSLVTGLLFIVMLQLNGCGGGSTTSESENTTPSNSFSGVAQKGPFSAGSEVRVEQLTEQGKPTANILHTQTTGTAANFNFTVPESWHSENKLPLQITVQGSYLDESYSGLNHSTSGDHSPASNHQITLNTLLEEPSNTSVNLLTHWTSLRAKFLMLREGKNISDALQQAATELQKYTGIAHISELDFSRSEVNSSDNLQLLLLSGALLEVAKSHDQSSQFVINEIAVDFAEDGIINRQGKGWFKRIQAKIRFNPKAKTVQYANVLSEHLGKTINTDALPNVISIAARPQALVPQTITVETGQTVTLDGGNSLSANGATLQYTWVRLDQQTQFDVPISNRFIANPTITAPQQTADLLFALFVMNEQQIADTAIVRVKARPPQPANQPPTANYQFINAVEDTQKNITLSGNDPDGDDLTFNLLGATPIILGHGTLEGNPPTLTYTPDENFSGTDYFDFTVSDASSTSETARVDITIDAVNDTPVVIGNQTITTNENAATTEVLTGWSDVDNDLSELTFSLVTQANNGQLSIVSSTEIQYTPNNNFFGSDAFSYQVSDGQGGVSNTATVTANVLSVNDNPNAIPPSTTLTTNQDTELAITLQGNDPDGDPITYELVTAPVIGGLFVDGNVVTFDSGVLAGSPPNLTYKPYSSLAGDDSFTFLVRDSNGSVSAVATVSIQVLFVNIQPQADPVTVTTNSNTSISITLTGSDGNDDPLSFTKTSNPAHGNLSGTVPNLVYAPHTNYIGSDAFTYEVSDGTDVSNTATVNITVNNQAPTANAGVNQTVTSGDEVTLQASGSTDPESQIRYAWTAPNGVALSNSTVVSPTFTAPTVTSTTAYTFTLVVTDDLGLDSAPDSIVITVSPLPNQAPTADAGIDRTLDANTSVTLNGSGIDLEDGTVTLFAWTAPAEIVLSNDTVANPTFTTPTVSISTDFTFTLIVTDSQGLASATDSIVITVTPPPTLPNQAPTANPGANRTVISGTEVTLNGSGSSDPEDGTVSFFSWTAPAGITLSNTAIANPTFIAPTVATPTDYTFKLIVKDSQGRFSFDPTVVITVKPANKPPTSNAGDDQVVTSSNKVTLNGSGTDQEGSVTYQWVSLDNIQLSNDTVTQPYFTPAVTMTTIYRFELKVTDEDQTTTSDTVQIIVTPTDRYGPGDSWNWEVVPASAYQSLTLTTYDITGLVSHDADPANTAEMDDLFNNLTSPQGSGPIAAIHTVNILDNNPFGSSEYYASHITGEIVVPEEGTYQFSIDGDDAIDLFIDGNLIVGWYGTHANCDGSLSYVCQATELTRSVSLTAGAHTITFRHEESIEHDSYRLFWKHLPVIDTSQPFIMKIQAVEKDFIIPTMGAGYNFFINCDSASNGIFIHVEDKDLPFSCHYTDENIHEISIVQDFPRIDFFQGAGTADIERSREKLLEVKQWGNIDWQTMQNAFYGCNNLTLTATDAPKLSNVENMGSMFSGASSMDSDINHWDVSQVKTMNGMFNGATSFNQSLNSWDISNVGTSASGQGMNSMFSGATAFNGDISNWDVSNVTDMSAMFYQATAFNQNIRSWDVGSVTSTNSMFNGASSFDQDLGTWQVEKIGDASGGMDAMFHGVTLSTPNYDSLLIGWSTKLQSGLTSFSAGNSKYSLNASISRLSFISRFGLGFDGGLDL